MTQTFTCYNWYPPRLKSRSIPVLVYVNDLPNVVHDSLTGMYADDTSLYSTGPSISAMEETMNRDLSKLCFCQ